MDKICTELSLGRPVAWETIKQAWEPKFPMLGKLAATPQDAVWHAEGNVDIHTGMVLEEVRSLTQEATFTSDEFLTLQLAAIFHDIGKPLATKTKEINGKERIVAPHHAELGRDYLCLRLQSLGLPKHVERSVLALTALHHDLRRLVADDAPEAKWRQLARQCSPRLLYWLEIADIQGRDCPDACGQIETIELFKMNCEALGLWDNAAALEPWASWREVIEERFSSRSPEFRAHAFHAAIRDAEAGTIISVEEAVARAYQLRDPAPKLTLLWGPAGAGKSEWIARHAPNADIVSLDELREEIAGKRADQSMNGQVMQAAKERLKRLLNPKGSLNIVWDATNLRRDFRGPITQLGFDYGAHVTICMLTTPIPTLLKRNKQRENPVPSSVLTRQLETLEWPEPSEAHVCASYMDDCSPLT